ncbi:MAG: EscI/YscI/HrpB family type III secretion system inner rod protein [Puniceicoccales bacterium]|nr:EscI/YscI/HrpB family type III secretion system inner rod protein [Puniceicoccales bacterium]
MPKINELVGKVLAQQATKLDGLEKVTMLDEGIVPPFRPKDGVFQEAMQGNAIFSDFGRGGVLKVGQKNKFAVPPLSPMQTPGGGVLNTIQSVRDQCLKIQHNVEALAAKKQDFSSADLVQMQYDVMQLSYINELSSKTADKTSQGAQTLFRNQG